MIVGSLVLCEVVVWGCGCSLSSLRLHNISCTSSSPGRCSVLIFYTYENTIERETFSKKKQKTVCTTYLCPKIKTKQSYFHRVSLFNKVLSAFASVNVPVHLMSAPEWNVFAYVCHHANHHAKHTKAA